MRKLSSKELTNGMFVQCRDADFGLLPNQNSLSPVIYQILIKNGKHFYKAKDSDWETNGELAKDIWYETELTKALNRESKLKELGI
jgi:hypothetical protein